MSFQFPDPNVQDEVINPITGSLYKWVNPPGKWIVASQALSVSEIIWEGELPPDPVGDFKLWYSTDTLELYFYYCDVNNVCAWVPTSAPITMLEDLDNTVFELRTDLTAVNAAVRQNEDLIGRTIYFGDSAPTIYADDVYDGVAYQSDLNYKFWLNTTNNQLNVLRKDGDAVEGYVYEVVQNDATLKDVCNNGLNAYVTDTPLAVERERGVTILTDQELRITHEDNPYIRLVDQSDGDAIEITLNDDHGHIDLSDVNDELHFKFGNIEQARFKGNGEAIFNGAVSVGFDEFNPQPAHAVPFSYYDGGQAELNDAIKEVQDSLLVLQDEIEQLSKTQDSGKWVYSSISTIPRQGQFTLSNSSGNPSTTWGLSQAISVDATDVGMEIHNFDTWEEDDTIEIFSADTGTFALYTLGINSGGGFQLKNMQRSKGVPVNNEEYEIRIFKLEAGLNPNDADERYVNKTGDTINGQLNFVAPSRTNQTWLDFKNSQKANQVSEIRVQRPYDADGGVNADGSTNNKGTGGLDIKLMANSDGTRLRILGGSGGNTEALVISGGGNGKQIRSNSSIQLGGGNDSRQVIWAKTGIAGHLSYGNNDDAARRISWGDSKVWIRSATLDMGSGQIINCANPDPNRNKDVANVEFVLKQIEDALQGADFDDYLKKSGGTMTGDINMNNKKINNLAPPTTGKGAVNRDYLQSNYYATSISDSRYTQGKFKITSSGTNFYIEPN